MSLRIYTRTGDDGTTGLFGGSRVSKTDLRIDAVGSVDELNANLGVAVSSISDEALQDIRDRICRVQNDLFAVGADLSVPLGEPGSHGQISIERISAERTGRLEMEIDALEAALPPLRRFILPGGSTVASQLHVCRAVCRRAERCVCALSQSDVTNPEIVRYLNRLSDLLFVLARTANSLLHVTDVPWIADAPLVATESAPVEDS